MRLGIPAAAALLIVTLLLTHERILLAVGDFLVVQDRLQPADIIHVIAGPDHRTDYAINLYQQGYGKIIFFTGGWCPCDNVYQGQHSRERAMEQGVPLEAIAIDDSQVTSTYAEVLRLKEFIARSQVRIRSVIVVSDPHHMWRARWAYRNVFDSQMNLQMAPVPFNLSPYQHRWWTDGNSRRFLKNEYLKIFYYIARYRLSWGPVREWLASLDHD
jgi:uncharacterized SAM-binding protein YcdF (DUF218 family)